MEQSIEKRQEANTHLDSTLRRIQEAGYAVDLGQQAALRGLGTGETYTSEGGEWSVTADDHGYALYVEDNNNKSEVSAE